MIGNAHGRVGTVRVQPSPVAPAAFSCQPPENAPPTRILQLCVFFDYSPVGLSAL
jgi:hypothetical protein